MGIVMGCEGKPRSQVEYPQEVEELKPSSAGVEIYTQLTLVDDGTFQVMSAEGHPLGVLRLHGGIAKEKNYWFKGDCRYDLHLFETDSYGTICIAETPIYTAHVQRNYTTSLGSVDCIRAADKDGKTEWEWQDLFDAEFYTNQSGEEEIVHTLNVNVTGLTTRSRKLAENPKTKAALISKPVKSAYKMQDHEGTLVELKYDLPLSYSPNFSFSSDLFHSAELSTDSEKTRILHTICKRTDVDPLYAFFIAFVTAQLSPSTVCAVKSSVYMCEVPNMVEPDKSKVPLILDTL